jgi:endonuclease-3
MGRLSAQCTDARVNIVSRELFSRFPTASSMAEAAIEEIEEIVKPCGLYKMKAKNIKDSSLMLIEEFDGKLQSQMEYLCERRADSLRCYRQSGIFRYVSLTENSKA